MCRSYRLLFWLKYSLTLLIYPPHFENFQCLKYQSGGSYIYEALRNLKQGKSVQKRVFVLYFETNKNVNFQIIYKFVNYELITAYLPLRVNLDKIMHLCWDFDASSTQIGNVSALDKHQSRSASTLSCLNSRAQSKNKVINLIHTWHKRTF